MIKKIKNFFGNFRKKGSGILLVLIFIMTISILTVELIYNAVVNSRLSNNLGDLLRAYYLAKSGVNVAKLRLKYFNQIRKMVQQVGGDLVNEYIDDLEIIWKMPLPPFPVTTILPFLKHNR